MSGEKIFKSKEETDLFVKHDLREGFIFGLRIGPKNVIIERDRVVYADFIVNKNKFFIVYIVFCGAYNELKICTVPEKGGLPEYLESYIGPFSAPKITFHQGEQLIFAHYYTDKSKLVCIRAGVCYDVSAGGSNHLTGLIDMGDCLVAAIDCDHYLKQDEKINGGVQPFDAFGIQIMRKPALLVYHLNLEGGILKSDCDAFIPGGAQLVQLARKGKQFFGAYMRFEKNSYVIYVTDFGEEQVVVDTCRIIRKYTYAIKGGKHVFDTVNGKIEKSITGGVEIGLVAGNPCGSMDLRNNRKMVSNKKSAPSKSMGKFWGDIRVRTDVSICSNNAGWHCGSLEDKYLALRHLNRWDFVAISDHDAHIDNNSWDETRLLNELYNIEGEYVAFNAYEWGQPRSIASKAGHYNVLFKGRGDVIRGFEKDSDTPEKLALKLSNPMREGMMIPVHTNDATFAIDWNQCPRSVTVAEIFGARGNSESMDCPLMPVEFNRKIKDTGCMSVGLSKLPLGFIGGGGHEGAGATCVMSYGLSREAIYEALVEKRCYATTGARIIMDFAINDTMMGGFVPPAKSLQASIFVEGTDDIVEAVLITDANKIPLAYRQNKINTTIKLPDNFVYAYVRVLQRNNEAAWSSPIFLG